MKSVDIETGEPVRNPWGEDQYVSVDTEYEETGKPEPRTFREGYTTTVDEASRPADTRRPVEPTTVAGIDWTLDSLASQARDVLKRKSEAQKEDPNKRYEALDAEMDRITSRIKNLTRERVRRQTSVSSAEASTALRRAELLQQVGRSDGGAEEVHEGLIARQREKLGSLMERVERTYDPVSQRRLQHAIDEMQRLGGDASEAQAFLAEAKAEHAEEVREGRIARQRAKLGWLMDRLKRANHPVNQRHLLEAINDMQDLGGDAHEAQALLAEAYVDYEEQKGRLGERPRPSATERPVGSRGLRRGAR